ncbi:hypothetical protein KAFR_0A05740 [Kazachstania africana CBS 2517]|uniref:Uncharacterized protein n=1 Tax=Kazachstania africana (strain ATCC 22294 / BCRC 22015 / CBS 2517 / CECT 1963 / NBRC 1671 / NRRL Y-8276) TaxID=1071382 RepID=H2ANQ9_KAZAF|nr:hypothetical protein KAFR_0A05740 [Kazachstania africana CBS 2517]CCF56009.1 hypothetical protein KAFR_0A05740 [Kazachstania africana CBS 2517]
MVNKNILLSLALLFTLASLLFVTISTAGASSNYKPITNVYIGEADISHINITKIIPELSNVMTFLGAALIYSNISSETLFGALKNLSQTAALDPILEILIDSDNLTSTLDSVVSLSPLLVSGNISVTESEVSGIEQVLALSSNTSKTLSELTDLVTDLSSSNSTSSSALTSLVFELLEDSYNATAVTNALTDLLGMGLTNLMSLLPALEIIEGSNNASATFESLVTLMNSSISTSVETVLLSTLSTSSNITSTIVGMESLEPAYKDALEAVRILFESAKNQTQTLSYLEEIISSNLTTSSVAKEAMADLTTIYDNNKDKETLMSTISSLTSSLTTLASSLTSTTTSELKSLNELLNYSTNSSATVELLDELESVLDEDTSLAGYFPDLVTLLEASTNATGTMEALLDLIEFASTSEATSLLPLVELLSQITGIDSVTSEQLYTLTPNILEYLNIPFKFRLSIFTLCKINGENKITTCSKSHAVQNLDFRTIIYDALLDSDFEPYVEALGLTKYDLQLQGKLLKKEKYYVPAVRAVLAFNLISIVLGFFLMICFTMMIVRPAIKVYGLKGCCFVLVTGFYFIATALSPIIISAMIQIIKSGTAADKFNVVYTSGAASLGLTWTSFCLSLFTCSIVLYIWWTDRKSAGAVVVDKEMSGESSDSSLKASKQEIKIETEKASDN